MFLQIIIETVFRPAYGGKTCVGEDSDIYTCTTGVRLFIITIKTVTVIFFGHIQAVYNHE